MRLGLYAPDVAVRPKCRSPVHQVDRFGLRAGVSADHRVERGSVARVRRHELLKLARSRILNQPNRYVDHIYGEHEVGGTDWLYISGVPFEELGFPSDLGTKPYPEFTREFLSAVPLVLVIWPTLLGGFYLFSKRREQNFETETTNSEGEDT